MPVAKTTYQGTGADGQPIVFQGEVDAAGSKASVVVPLRATVPSSGDFSALTSTPMFANNPVRKCAIVYNEGPGTLAYALGTADPLVHPTGKIVPGQTYFFKAEDFGEIAINGAFLTAGTARLTETV